MESKDGSHGETIEKTVVGWSRAARDGLLGCEANLRSRCGKSDLCCFRGQSPIEDKPLPSELKLRPVRTRRYNKACEKTFPVFLTLVSGFSYTGVIQFYGIFPR